jgi:alpha-tubulin suppressor-like RCC1 family protein
MERDLRYDKIYTGGHHIYGHQIELSKMYGWGDNTSRQLRQDNQDIYTRQTRIKDNDHVIQIIPGDNCSFKLDSSGLYSYGLDKNGILGIGHCHMQSTPYMLQVKDV